MAVSLVLVSVSTDTQLSVLLMTPRKMSFNFCGSTCASVNTIAIRVAMFGSIMPTPLATPTTRAVDPAMVADEILCTVSVVMMPRATSSASLSGSGKGSDAIPARMLSMGYRRPMTPVEAMSTSLLVNPSADATDDVTSSAWRMPSSPVATLAFFEITTTARADKLATLRREIITLGPANLL